MLAAQTWALAPADDPVKSVSRTTRSKTLLARASHGSGQVAQVVERSPEKAGVGGSTPSLATMFQSVRSGDIGNRTFRRHRLHFWPEGVLQGLQGFFLQINIAEIVIHKTNQPDAMVDFFDADGLAGEGH